MWPDQSIRHIQANGLVQRDASGLPVRVVGTNWDITQRKQTELELRWKTAFLEAQLNSSPDGILVVDGRGKKLLQNQRMNQLLKIPAQIASAGDDREQLQFVQTKVKNPQAFLDKVGYLNAHPEEIGQDEIELMDGTILDRYSAPVLGTDHTHYGRLWVFRDITEQRALEAQLRQSQKLEGIGQLAGGVAHDFNNLLAVIRANAELLLMDGDSLKPEDVDCLKQVVGASDSAANLTRQLLLFSRKQAMRSQPLLLNELVTNLLKMLKRTIPEHIELECSLAERLPFVQADYGMMEQVILNLVVNSRDALPGGGRIQVATGAVKLSAGTVQTQPNARPGDFVCLSVTDTGSGIAAEHLPHVFEPFFTTKEPGQGTGLGLATIYGIAQQHRGWVEVSSQVGKGSLFKGVLPAIAAPAAPGEAPEAATQLPGGSETILLVEDDFQVRSATRRVLTRYGYKVCEASYGQEALEVWEQHAAEIAMLLSDIVMPRGMSGRDVAEKLRDRRPELRVLFMSGYSAEVIGKDTGFFRRTKSSMLHKPFTINALVLAVRQCLDEHP